MHDAKNLFVVIGSGCSDGAGEEGAKTGCGAPGSRLLSGFHAPRSLGRTGLSVSRLCLGTMTFGLQCDEATSVAIIVAPTGRYSRSGVETRV